MEFIDGGKMRRFELLSAALSEPRCLPGLKVEKAPEVVVAILATLREPIEAQGLDFTRIAGRLQAVGFDRPPEMVYLITDLEGIPGLERPLAAVGIVPAGFFWHHDAKAFVRVVVVAMAPDGEQAHRLLKEIGAAMEPAAIEALTGAETPSAVRSLIFGGLDREDLLRKAHNRFRRLYERGRISPTELFCCTDPITHELDSVVFPPVPSEVDAQARFKSLVDDFMIRQGWKLEGGGAILIDELCREIWEFQRVECPFSSSGEWEHVSREL